MISVVVSYSQSEFEQKYAELRRYKVTIPTDITSTGLSGLSVLVSTVQGYKTRVTELMNEAMIMKAHAKVQSESAEHAYEASLDLIINTDIEVINMPSDRTRVARANKKLKAELEHVKEAKTIFSLIDVYYKSVVHIFNDLESANKNLETQTNIYKKMMPPNFEAHPTYSPSQQQSTIPIQTQGVKLLTEA